MPRFPIDRSYEAADRRPHARTPRSGTLRRRSTKPDAPTLSSAKLLGPRDRRVVLPALLWAALALAIPAAANAQSAANTEAAAAEEEPIRDVRFRGLLLDRFAQGTRPVRFHSQEDGPQTLRLSSTFLSQPTRYVGPDPLVFQGEEADAIVGTCRLPTGLDEAILLFSPGGTNEAGETRFRVRAYPDTFARAPLGTYRFFNFTDQRLAIDLQGTRALIEPNDNQVIRPDTDEPVDVIFQLATGKDGDWQRVMQRNWFYRPDLRKLVLIYAEGDNRERIRYKVVNDTRKPESTTP